MMNDRYKNNAAFTAALISFAVVAIAILPVLIFNKGQLFLVGDYMTQQIPFMKECRRVILSGTPFWSVNTFLGANFIGTYSFYVYGSPFFLPLLLIPEKLMTYALAPLFVLKHSVAALTSGMFLSRHINNKNLIVIGSLMYAFSGFSIDSGFYYHFLDVIALFPLILYFSDCVLDGKRKPMLSLAAFFCATTNYYFFISTSFIFLFYLFFRVSYSEGKYGIKDGIRCIFSYGLGGLAAAVILIPSALCLLETSKATNSYSAGFASILSTFPQYIKFIEAVTLPSEGILNSGTGFSYFVYSSTAAFLPFFGALFYFVSLIRKEKIWSSRLLRFFTVLTLVPLGNGLFSLFTNMSYTRWWYGFVLIMILESLRVSESIKDGLKSETELRKSGKLIAVFAGISVLGPLAVKALGAYAVGGWLSGILPEAVTKYFSSSGFTQPFGSTDIRYLLVLVFLTALSYVPLWFAIKRKWLFTRKVVPAVAIICAVTLGTYLTNEFVTYYQRSPQTYSEEAEASVSDKTEYTSRVRNNKSLANFSMISNEPAISTFHSFKSHATSEFARIVGYDIGPMPDTKAYFSTPAIQTVLSIETLVSKDSERTPAQYYTPMGYVYNYYVEDNCVFTKNIKENDRRIEQMTYACFLDAETAQALSDVVKPLDGRVTDWKSACIERKNTACTDFVMDTSGFKAVSDGKSKRLVYFSIPHDNGWKAYVNGKETEIYTVNGGLMGVVVPAGRAEIEFRFTVPGLAAGAAVSLASFAAIGIYALTDLRRKKKNLFSVDNLHKMY